MLMREEPVDLLLKVIRRRSGSESDAGYILLVMRLQLLRKLRRLADAHQQHASGQRIQRAGMPYLEILLAEMTDRGELDLSDHVRRSPSVWLVYRDYYPFRIVIDASGERR